MPGPITLSQYTIYDQFDGNCSCFVLRSFLNVPCYETALTNYTLCKSTLTSLKKNWKLITNCIYIWTLLGQSPQHTDHITKVRVMNNPQWIYKNTLTCNHTYLYDIIMEFLFLEIYYKWLLWVCKFKHLLIWIHAMYRLCCLSYTICKCADILQWP